MIESADVYDARFFDMVELDGRRADDSLEGLSGLPSDPGPYPTSLIERCEAAWRTPLAMLTCNEVRTLVGQRMGLEWLGAPAIDFAGRYPTVTNLYPGDMTLACLRAADELLTLAGPEMRFWLAGDFSWMDEILTWDEAPLDEARALLAAARSLAVPQ